MESNYIITYSGSREDFCKKYGIALYDAGFDLKHYIERAGMTFVIGECLGKESLLEERLREDINTGKLIIEKDHRIYVRGNSGNRS